MANEINLQTSKLKKDLKELLSAIKLFNKDGIYDGISSAIGLLNRLSETASKKNIKFDVSIDKKSLRDDINKASEIISKLGREGKGLNEFLSGFQIPKGQKKTFVKDFREIGEELSNVNLRKSDTQKLYNELLKKEQEEKNESLKVDREQEKLLNSKAKKQEEISRKKEKESTVSLKSSQKEYLINIKNIELEKNRLRALGRSEDEINDITKEYIRQIKLLKQLDRETEDWAKATAGVKTELNKVRSEVNRAEKPVKTLGSNIKEAFSPQRLISRGSFVVTARLAYNAIDLINNSVRGLISNTIDFESQMSKVFTLLQDSSKEIRRGFGEEALGLVKEYGLSLEEAARLQYDLFSARFTGQDVTGISQTAAQLSVAEFADPTVALKNIITIMKSFDKEDADEVADFLSNVITVGRTTLDQVGQDFGKIASLAGGLGISLNELGAQFSKITQETGDTKLAITTLRQLYLTLTKPTQEAQDIIDRRGLDVSLQSLREKGIAYVLDQLSELSEQQLATIASSRRGIVALTALYEDGNKELNEFIELFEKRGEAERKYNERANTSAQILERISGLWKTLFIDNGGTFSNALKSVLSITEKILTKANDVFGANERSIAISSRQEKLKRFEDELSVSGSGYEFFDKTPIEKYYEKSIEQLKSEIASLEEGRNEYLNETLVVPFDEANKNLVKEFVDSLTISKNEASKLLLDSLTDTVDDLLVQKKITEAESLIDQQISEIEKISGRNLTGERITLLEKVLKIKEDEYENSLKSFSLDKQKFEVGKLSEKEIISSYKLFISTQRKRANELKKFNDDKVISDSEYLSILKEIFSYEKKYSEFIKNQTADDRRLKLIQNQNKALLTQQEDVSELAKRIRENNRLEQTALTIEKQREDTNVNIQNAIEAQFDIKEKLIKQDIESKVNDIFGSIDSIIEKNQRELNRIREISFLETLPGIGVFFDKSFDRKLKESDEKINLFIQNYIKKIEKLRGISSEERNSLLNLGTTLQEQARQKLEEERRLSARIEAQQYIVSQIQDIWSSFYDWQQNRIQETLNKDIEALQKRAESQNRSQEYIQRETEKLNKEAEKEQKRLANVQKGISIIQAGINTAVAVTKALEAGPILGPILASAIGILGGAQVAFISQQKFRDGGYSGNGIGYRDETGKKQAGIVHEKEFIMKEEATKGNVGTFYAMQDYLAKGGSFGDFAKAYLNREPISFKHVTPKRSHYFAGGGFSGSPTKTPNIPQQPSIEDILNAVEQRPINFSVKVGIDSVEIARMVDEGNRIRKR